MRMDMRQFVAKFKNFLVQTTSFISKNLGYKPSNKSTKKLETKINARYTRNNRETELCPHLEFCEYPALHATDNIELMCCYCFASSCDIFANV